jgi:hypothetical protein
MAEKLGPDGKPLATGGEPGGVRFPEDELADIERKADEAAKVSEQDGGEKTGDEVKETPDDDDASVAKLQSFMQKKGIKDIVALVDLTADLESKNTKLGQDVQRLSAVTQAPLGEPGGFSTSRVRPQLPEKDEDIPLPENLIELVTDRGKLQTLMKSVKKMARDEYEQGRQAEEVDSHREEVARKQAENPEKFEELRPTMFELAGKFPTLRIDQLYAMAEKRVVDKDKALIDKFKTALGLDNVDTAKLKDVLKRARVAPISSGTGRQVDIPESEKKKADAELLTAIANADKY